MPNSPVIRLSFPEPDIALLTLDDPNKGANVLSSHVLEELSAHLDVLEKRNDLQGLVIRSGKPGSFIAGADLREFAASFEMPKKEVDEICHRGRKLFQRLSKCRFVTVAAIDGICVGGGAELAIWCDRRVMADDAENAIRLSRSEARPVSRLGRHGAGLADRRPCRTPWSWSPAAKRSMPERRSRWDWRATLCRQDRIQDAAIRLIRAEQATKQYLDDRKRWSGPIEIDETELGFLGATASGYIQQQTKGQYPAPLAALEVMLGAAGVDIDAACEMEAEGMAALFGSPVNRALINVFFLTDRNKKDTGVDRECADAGDQIGRRGRRRHHGAGHRRGESEARSAGGDGRCGSQSAGRGVQKILEEVSYNKLTKGPDPQRAVKYAALLNATTADVGIGGLRLGDRSDRRKPRREAAAVRPAGAAAAR